MARARSRDELERPAEHGNQRYRKYTKATEMLQIRKGWHIVDGASFSRRWSSLVSSRFEYIAADVLLLCTYLR